MYPASIGRTQGFYIAATQSVIMFAHDTRVTLRDTDAAGITFFANHFTLAHVAYEAFLQHHGFPLGELLKTSPYLLPIVHAEADFRHPLQLGAAVRIEVTAARIGTKSFTLKYVMKTDDGAVASTVETVHAVIERAVWKSTEIPERLRAALHSIQVAEHEPESR